jgi:hypothetical protein
MSTLTTTNVGSDVQIDWVAPYDNSDILTGFRIYIRGKDLQYYETDSCLAMTLPLPLTCSIPMTVLYADPFYLT